MKDDSKLVTNPEDMEWTRLHMQNWRSWGSWFSWGSPIGLGLFLVLVSASLYVLHLAEII